VWTTAAARFRWWSFRSVVISLMKGNLEPDGRHLTNPNSAPLEATLRSADEGSARRLRNVASRDKDTSSNPDVNSGGDQFRFIACIDRPGPVAVAGGKISVRGWAAGPAPVCEVSLSINHIGVATPVQREARSDLIKLGYPEANVFAYKFFPFPLPNIINSDVSIAVDAKLANGQTFRSAQTFRIVESVEDALRFIGKRPDERVWSYLHLALDLVGSGRLHEAKLVTDSANRRFPRDPVLQGMTKPDGALGMLRAELQEEDHHKSHARLLSSSSGSKTKIVCACRRDGIGTRLLTMIYARIFSETIGYEFKVIWPNVDTRSHDNRQLFHPNFRHRIFLKDYVFEGERRRGDFTSLEEMDGRHILYLSNEVERLASMDIESFKAFADDFDVIWYDQPKLLLQSLKYGVDIPSEVRRLWKCIAWNREITLAVDHISIQLPLQECIAVHIRRGDLINLLLKADIDSLRILMALIFRRYSPIQTVVDVLGRMRNDEKILLCCEDRNVRELLLKKYGADIIYLSNDLFKGADDQRAIIDMMLLSRSKILIAPFSSYFSRCAAEIGSCKYVRLEMDLPLIAEELSEIVDTINSERELSVKALIRTTAAELGCGPIKPEP
jgi:hypothetical protein